MKIEKFIQKSPSTLIVLGALSIQQKTKQDLKALDLNLNLLQALVLTAVFFEQDEPVMVTKIVKATGLSKSNVSQIISHLESEGLLIRTLNKEDQRIWLLKTTKKAGAVVPKIVSYFDSVQNQAEKFFEEKKLNSFFEVAKKVGMSALL